MISGMNEITYIAILMVKAQQEKQLESSFSIEKGSVFIHIKQGEEQLYNFVEPISYFEDHKRASSVSSRIVEILEDSK